MIKGLDHFALSVSDVDQSIAFYRDILGLEFLRVIEVRSEMEPGYIHAGFTSTDGRADYGRLRERGGCGHLGYCDRQSQSEREGAFSPGDSMHGD